MQSFLRKKLLAIAFLLVMAVHAFAQTGVKISEMPTQPGNPPIPSTAQIPFQLGGVNFKGSIANPNGLAGDVQTNGGSTGFGSFSLSATAGSGSATNGLLLNNNGVTQAVSVGTVGGIANIVTPPSLAANALYQASNGLEIDPRGTLFGAVCNAQYADGRSPHFGTVTMTSGNPVIRIGGYVWKLSDVGSFISLNNGGAGDAGIGTTTIISVDLNANTATIGASPNVTSTGGYAVWGNDDTAAFASAAAQSVLVGGEVIVPDKCLVRELHLPVGTRLKGARLANGYTYGNNMKPTLYILSTGYTEDATSYGINITGSNSVSLDGFAIQGSTFPFMGFSNINLSCIGTDSGNAGTADAIVLEHMTIQYCPIGLGVAFTHTSSGYTFGKSHFSEYASNGWGMRGDFSDWESTGDVFTGDFSGGMSIGPNGTGNGANAGRVNGDRFEEDSIGVLCDSCVGLTMTGDEWQFNNDYGIKLNGSWGNITVTGGNMVGQGQTNASAHKAYIGVTSNSGSGHLRVSGMGFIPDGENYVLDATTSVGSTDISIEGGYAKPSIAPANFEVNNPSSYKFDVFQQPLYVSGLNDFSFNVNHALGLQTTSAAVGSILDASLASTITNSSIILPNGSAANRPATPVNGMVRYDTTTLGYEGYSAGSWISLSSPVVNNYIGGLTLSNDVSTPNTTIDIAAGIAASEEQSAMMVLPTTYYKTTSAWAVGNGNGCLDTGSVANSTWYSVFEIENFAPSPPIVDVLCSTSASNPLMPTNYTARRRLGSIKTDGSAHIVPFTQDGSTVWWTTPTLDVNTSLSDTSTHLETLNVPVGVKTAPLCSYAISGTGNATCLFSPDTVAGSCSTTNPFSSAPGFSALSTTSTNAPVNSGCPYLTTNTASQVTAEMALSTTTTIAVATQGWKELNQPAGFGILAIDGISPVTAIKTTQSFTSNPLTTTNPKDVIIVWINNTYSGPGGSVASVSDTAGLTWTHRKTRVYFSGTYALDEWYAIAPAPLTGDVITVGMTSTGGYVTTVTAYGISGADTNTVFDPNVSFPASNNTTNSAVSTTFSTTHAHDMIISAYGLFNGSGVFTRPSGFTTITTSTNQSFDAVYKIVSSTLSSFVETYTPGASASNGLITDAIMATGP